MGWHLEQKSRKQQSWISSSSLGSLVCLVTLLVHLSLPSVHQYEHILESTAIMLNDQTRKRTYVHLGPVWYLEHQGLELRCGWVTNL